MPSYFIEVEGSTSDALRSRLPTLLATPSPVGTVLHGELPDQSALLGAISILDLFGYRIHATGIVPAREPVEDRL